MRSQMAALCDLAKLARSETASVGLFPKAAQIIRKATGTAEVLIVYAEDDEFLISRDGESPPLNDLSPRALTVVERNLKRTQGPVAFNLAGTRVQDFCDADSAADGQYLAFHVPTSEAASEMCVLRGPWPQNRGPGILRFMESALPSLILLCERSLNAERSARQRRDLETLANAAQILTRAENMESPLTDLASSIAAATGFSIVSMEVYDAERQRFILRVLSEFRWASSSLARIWKSAFDPDRPDKVRLAVLQSGEPELAYDLQHAEHLSENDRAFYRQALLASRVTVPMMFQDEPLGTMSFLSFEPQSFPPEQVDYLRSIAGQMAAALKAMRMYGELARSREEARQYARRIEGQQRKLRSQARQLRKMASTDALTAAYNYAGMHDNIDRCLAKAQREGTPLSVLVGDVDNFKLFNDTHGHLAGDEALKAIADVLRSSCRRYDVVSRCGGDEFIVVMPNTDRQGAARVARRIHQVLENAEFGPADAPERVPLRLAMGIAVFPEDGTTKDALIGHADAAMYESKGLGPAKLPADDEADDIDVANCPISAFSLLDGLVRAVDRRDHYTKAHAERNAELATLLGQTLGLSSEPLSALRIAGLLHDIGKIGIPDRILRKAGDLTDREREAMQQHVLLSERIIAGVPHVQEVLAAASSHHERFDGEGYPRGLKGDQIPLLGRILAVVDAYAAMTEDRPYRKALSREEAVGELRRCSGTQFDPAIVRVFISDILPRIESRKTRAA